MMKVSENWSNLRAQMGSACATAGRPLNSVQLLAVSKTQSQSAIAALAHCGQRAFGENYVQELVTKAEALSDLQLEWHFIGHLQRNKINALLPHLHMIHSIDSIALAEALAKRTARPLVGLIEINVGDETSKTGIAPAALQDLLNACRDFKNLKIQGLMCIPPASDDPGRYFTALANLQAQANREHWYRAPLTELSMGMSHDFAIAIVCGATYIRVGTQLFGERKSS